MKRIASLCCIAVLGLSQAGCDPKFGLSLSLALVGVDRVVDAKVADGAITQPKGVLIKRDFRDLRDGGTVFDADFKAAGEDKSKRSQAAIKFGRTGTAIVARGNLVNLDPTVQSIADTSLAIVDEILAYYAPPSNLRAGAVRARSEDQLKKSIEAKIEQLKQALKDAPTETSQVDLRQWDEGNRKRNERLCGVGDLDLERQGLDRPPNK